MARTRLPRSLAAVVLAAGKGRRLKSSVPKPLHEVCGRPVLWHVLRAVSAARPDPFIVVVSKIDGRVAGAIRSWGIRPEPVLVEQAEQLGTGHAVMVAQEAIGEADDVLVAPGDEPLLTAEQVRELVRTHRRRSVAAVIQTTVAEDPRGFARVIRVGDMFERLVEGSEASPDELRIAEVSTAVFAFRRKDLFDTLPLVTRENRQREYYLPDVVDLLRERRERIAIQLVDNGGVVGVNSRSELARAAAVMRARINESHMTNGVTILDPASTYIDVGVRIGRDTEIHPQTFLEGSTRIGEGSTIGPLARLVDTVVGARAEVTFSVAREARIGPGASVGPYASLRPGTVLADDAKAGSFVEVKNSRVGRRSKVPHLAYVGDATIGADANIGAGTVTVNYDGFDKHETVVGDGARVGSDTMLVAPVKVGRRAFTGAGSVITKDVPDGALGVERADQVNVPGYADRREARAKARAKRSEVSGSAETVGRSGRKRRTRS